jgi:universal stress protein E
VDPGHANDKPAALDYRILDYASLLSKRLGGELHVLHAYIPIVILAAASATSPQIGLTVSAEELAFEEHEMRERVQALVTEYRVDAANVHLEIGGPAEVLPRLAGALQAHIVTMGAISRSGVQRAFIGSTAEDVLERLPCDALIVKPPDFAAMLPF